MSLKTFLLKIESGEHVSFNETMRIIASNYHYQPTEFHNGSEDAALINPAGTNEGSCKIFAFAQLNQLDKEQTLSLFGHYYWQEVLGDLRGSSHQNIRHFMHYGWQGIKFQGEALHPR